ncbi:Urease, partial [Coniochaeta hoffmannii]
LPLSDSALPLGSFAFSSGLESFLAHTTRTPTPPPQLFTTTFLPLSISSYASTTLPFVLAAHADPAALPSLDDALDASTICTVARRASVAQGRALLGIWERSLSSSAGGQPAKAAESSATPLLGFAALLRSSSHTAADDDDGASLPPAVSAHLPPLFGAVCRAAGLDAQQTALVYMLNHVKALVSAAVRRGMFGPYQAQKILASAQVRDTVEAVVRREWDTPYYEAGQSIPVMDLWVGRHEMLYSRIFNS